MIYAAITQAFAPKQVSVERIDLLRRHPEGESDRPAALNASLVSHTDAGVSNYCSQVLSL
jgi:hypothetical protein